VGASQTNNYVATGSTTSNNLISDSRSLSFTGLDSSGDTQTYAGTALAQSDYGRLRIKATGNVTNAYYNAENPPYTDASGNTIDPNGSPAEVSSISFALFNDTLQFGGTLQSGYKVRYIFHVDGITSGTNAFTSLRVNVDEKPTDEFTYGGLGFVSTNRATHDFDVNSVAPQNINVRKEECAYSSNFGESLVRYPR
jgi:hypothetical protein